MFNLVIVLTILFIFAIAIQLYFKHSIGVALFEVVCGIIILLTVAGMFNLMHVGQILIYVLAGLSLLYIAYEVLIRKSKIDLLEIATPSTVLILFAVVFYYLAVRNNVFHIKDEVTAYGFSVKRMLLTNTIGKYGCVPTFAYFFNKIFSYSEGMVFTAKWLFLWTCIGLPIAHIKWDKWYLVFVYGLLSFGVLTIINPEPMFLMDASVGALAGAIIGYFAVNLKKTNPFLLGMGLILLPMVKDMAGILFWGFSVIFIALLSIIIYLDKDYKANKKSLIKVGIVIFSLVFGIFLSNRITGIPRVIKNSSVFSFKAIMLYIFILTIFAVFLFFAKRHIIHKISKKAKGIVATIMLFVIVAVGYKATWMVILSFDFNSQLDFVYVLTKYFTKGYFNIGFIVLLGMLVIFITLISVLALKKEYIKYAVSQLISIILISFIYSLVIGYIFTVQYSELLSNLNGLERYMGSLAIMILVWLMALIFGANNYWQKDKAQLVCVGIIGILIIRSYPVFGETMFNVYNGSTRSFKNGVMPAAEVHAKILDKNTEGFSRVLFVNQNYGENYSHSGFEYWIRYFVPKIDLGYRVSSFTIDKERADEDYLTHYVTYDEFIGLVKKSNYIYVLSTDEEFWEAYGALFPERFEDSSGRLFKVNADADEILESIPLDKTTG